MFLYVNPLGLFSGLIWLGFWYQNDLISQKSSSIKPLGLPFSWKDRNQWNKLIFSLLKVIGVERTATPQEIRKAYHKLALRLHPDKNQDDEVTKILFLCLPLRSCFWVLCIVYMGFIYMELLLLFCYRMLKRNSSSCKKWCQFLGMKRKGQSMIKLALLLMLWVDVCWIFSSMALILVSGITTNAHKAVSFTTSCVFFSVWSRKESI